MPASGLVKRCAPRASPIRPGAGGLLPIYLATRPVDLPKGHGGLSALAQEMFGLNPFSGAVFVFRSKRADRIKVLVWDQTGLVSAFKAAYSSTRELKFMR